MDPYWKFREKFEEQRARTNEGIAAMERAQLKLWEKLAPGVLPQLLKTREDAERFITHADASVRRVAIEVLWHRWGATADEAFRSNLEKTAFADPDPWVRSSALSALADARKGSDDVRLGALFASTVYDDAAPYEVRWFAYQGLFRLRGMRMPLPSHFFIRPGWRPQIPADVDWSFVDAFLVPGRTASPSDPFDVLPEWMRSYCRSSHLAHLAYERAEYEEAVAHLTAALRQKPNAPGLFYRRGHAYLELGNFDSAIADYTEAIRLQPNFAMAYYDRGIGYRKKGDQARAESDFEQAKRLGFAPQ